MADRDILLTCDGRGKSEKAAALARLLNAQRGEIENLVRDHLVQLRVSMLVGDWETFDSTMANLTSKIRGDLTR